MRNKVTVQSRTLHCAANYGLSSHVRTRSGRDASSPSRSDFACLDACNRKPKAELLRKKSIFARAAAVFMAAALGIAASGCGVKEQPENEPGTQADVAGAGSSAETQGDMAEGSGKGRYVESTVYEGSGFSDRVQTQVLADGRIVFLNGLMKQMVVSQDGGDSWEVEANDAFYEFIDVHYPYHAAIAEDGTIALIGMDRREDSPEGKGAEYDFNLYIYDTDNTSRQIPFELPDADSTPSYVAFDNEKTLYLYVAGCKNIYKVDIDAGTSEKLVTLADSCQMMQCRDNILMCMTSEKIFLYDLDAKSFIEDEMFDSFIRENYGDLEWTGGGYTAYPFLCADNTICVAGDKGLYRHVIGGSAVEQVIDGALSSLGAPSNSIMAVNVNDKNEFLAAYGNGKIIKFYYDGEVSSVPDNKITVYSLRDDDLVRQTIAVYQTQNPEVFVEYQIGLDEGGITREDALKKLNTQLLGGSGPDVIMLDGIDIETYAEKGVLRDLSDIVDEIDGQDGLYRNLIDGLASEGVQYVVPGKFYLPVLLGNAAYVDNVNDYPSMADAVEQARGAYPDTNLLVICSAEGIMRRFVPVCAPSWKDDNGQLDQAKIREFLEQSRRIYDVQMNGTPQEEIVAYQRQLVGEDGENFEEGKYFMLPRKHYYMMQESPFVEGEVMDAYTYRDMLSIPRAQGMEGTVFRPLNGQSSNVYHPASLAGISAAAKNPDAAAEFVRVMLGSTVQETLECGLPVNKKALPAQFAYEESELGEDGGQFYTSSSSKDGRGYKLTIYPVEQDGIDRLERWIAESDTPYLSNAVLEEAVYKEGAAYLEGRQDIDTAVKAVADSVEIYLYE